MSVLGAGLGDDRVAPRFLVHRDVVVRTSVLWEVQYPTLTCSWNHVTLLVGVKGTGLGVGEQRMEENAMTPWPVAFPKAGSNAAWHKDSRQAP